MEHISLYDPCQSGFRIAHSTLDPLIRIESDIRKSLMMNEYTVAVFLDVTQAFDTVWHQELLQKIKQIGIDGAFGKLYHGNF